MSLGAKDAADLAERNPAFLGVIVGRIANRVAGAAFHVEGKVQQRPPGAAAAPSARTPWHRSATPCLSAALCPGGKQRREPLAWGHGRLPQSALAVPVLRRRRQRCQRDLRAALARRPRGLPRRSGRALPRVDSGWSYAFVPWGESPVVTLRARPCVSHAQATATYTLAGRTLSIDLRAVSAAVRVHARYHRCCLQLTPLAAQATTPLALTSHAYWNLGGNFGASVGDHVRARRRRCPCQRPHPFDASVCVCAYVRAAPSAVGGPRPPNGSQPDSGGRTAACSRHAVRLPDRAAHWRAVRTGTLKGQDAASEPHRPTHLTSAFPLASGWTRSAAGR